MGIKWSQFAQANSLSGTDQGVGLKNGSNVRWTLNTLLAWIIDNILPSDIGAVPATREINGQALTSDITLDADDVGAAVPPEVGSVSLSASWSGAGPYYQTVTVTGATVTANSKVDIQLTAAQISGLISAGVTGMVIENNAGTLTAYAVGAQTGAMSIQVTVTEVE